MSIPSKANGSDAVVSQPPGHGAQLTLPSTGAAERALPSIGASYVHDSSPVQAARIALLAVWAVIALMVLADISESARGDSYLTRAIPWDLLAGAILSVLILGLDSIVRASRNAPPVE